MAGQPSTDSGTPQKQAGVPAAAIPGGQAPDAGGTAPLTSAAMSARLSKLSARLLNLNRANKTIRLLRKTKDKHFDLCELLAFQDCDSRPAKILDAVVKGKGSVIASAKDKLDPEKNPGRESHAGEVLEEWTETTDAELDADVQANAKEEARALAESERLALEELGANPGNSTAVEAKTTGTPDTPKSTTGMKDATYVEGSEDELAEGERPAIVRTWLRRRKVEGFERLDKDLAAVRNFTDGVETETGSQDLHLGWPFLTGVCSDIDKTYLQAPLMLFPVELVKDRQPQARWRVVRRKDADPIFNETLAFALESYHKTTLSDDFLEAASEKAMSEPPELPAFLAAELARAGLTVSTEPFPEAPSMLPEYRTGEVPEDPVGSFAIANHAVIGYFPQADSALRLDYEHMLETVKDGGMLTGHVSMLLAALDENGNYNGGDQGTDDPAIAAGVVDQASEKDQWFVLDTDSSQEEVLLAARREQRLVVHGPPGTGKSQVIVNLISDALRRGEKVALVCQKRAALDVVFQRLDSVGLSRHVALVHDHAGDRRALYQRISNVLGETLNVNAQAQRELEAEITRLARVTDECTGRLGSLARELHLPRECGFTVRQLYARLANVPAGMRTISDEAAKLAPTLNRDRMIELQRRLDVLEAIHREIDTVNHPWSARKSFANLGQGDLQRIHAALDAALDACGKADAKTSEHPDLKVDPAQAAKVLAVAQTLRDSIEPVAAPVLARANLLLAKSCSSQDQERKATALAELADRLAKHVPATSARPTVHCDDKDLLSSALALETYAAKATSLFRIFDGAYRQAKPVAAAYLAKAGIPLDKAPAVEHAANLRAAAVWREIDAQWSGLPAGTFPAATTGVDLASAAAQLLDASKASQSLEVARNGLGPALGDRVLPMAAGEEVDAKSALLSRLDRVREVAEALVRARKAVEALAPWLEARAIAKLGNEGLAPPRLAASKIRDLQRGMDDFAKLEAWDAAIGTLTPDARALVDALRHGRTGKGAESWSKGIEPGIFGWWIDRIERDAPVLRDVSRREAQVLRDTLAQSLRERRVKMRELLAAELLYRALHARFEPGRLVDGRFSAERPWKDLNYQVSKKSRHYSLRRLYSEFRWPLMNAMPCWLVSPETMSAVFPNQPGVFDLVIFDEASQCPVENGLPAAARGTRIVIAGDEQQLRPSDLFRQSAGAGDEEGEEADDGADGAATEAESLLTLARARFPERMLMWHYRSKYEELIDFSNHGFYQARLKSVPDLSAVREPPPIEYVKVAGKWEGRCNRMEAAALVEDLHQRLKGRWSRKTVGVVTFGVTQRTAIEEEIEHRRSLDEEFDAVFSAAFKPASGRLDDALFIKNIENVQGDERDVIVFSVGYAADTRGRMVTNFGSLSQDGGENRLNVAVSRAREQIVVFASIEPAALNVAASRNRGPRLFRQYLEYARAVSHANREIQHGVLRDISGGLVRGSEAVLSFDSPFEEEVHAALEREGLVVRSQIGVSGFRIDLAVVDPNDHTRYCLGIECDGATYHSAPSVRERDVYRQRSLEMRGWKIHRIWSRNWWADPRGEVARVVELVKGK